MRLDNGIQRISKVKVSDLNLNVEKERERESRELFLVVFLIIRKFPIRLKIYSYYVRFQRFEAFNG